MVRIADTAARHSYTSPIGPVDVPERLLRRQAVDEVAKTHDGGAQTSTWTQMKPGVLRWE